MDTETPSPIETPTITLGGREYPLKFRLRDVVWLWKTHQIDLATRVQGAEAFMRIAPMIVAATAHLGEPALTVEQVEEQIELGELPVYLEKLVEAQKKATPAATAAAQRINAQVQTTNGTPAPPLT